MNEELKNLLEKVVKEDASDLHLVNGRHPTLRIDSQLTPLTKEAILMPEHCQELVLSLLTEEQKKELAQKKEIDFSYQFREKARFRVNAYYQSGYLSAALRLIPTKIRTIEELNLPSILHEFTKPSQGFVLITGPAGHGKSTVMAALIDEINHNRTDHIITIEDPVEYVFIQDKCIISQREVGRDTETFHRALRSSFRQDPDVVMVGEMRDPESISMTVTAAETGHLIFSSLHTNTASQSIDRIIDSFPAAQQAQIRTQLAGTLLGVVSRRLIPRLDGGLISAAEVLITNSAVRNLIREGKTHQIDLVIETSSHEGMISLNRALADLVKKGEISNENAEIYSTDVQELRMLLQK